MCVCVCVCVCVSDVLLYRLFFQEEMVYEKQHIGFKALFIITTDAHNYKITGMLKQLKFRQLLRHAVQACGTARLHSRLVWRHAIDHVINDEHNRIIIVVLAKHEINP